MSWRRDPRPLAYNATTCATTCAMISDPKLPFAQDSADGGERGPLAESAVPIVPGDGSQPTLGKRSVPSAGRLWLRRVGVLLFVFFCATLGVMLMILPWRPEWSDNPLLTAYPGIRAVAASGFVRGVSSGLGLVNVWIGFWEAVQYRED
jgi:hypothetical protein